MKIFFFSLISSFAFAQAPTICPQLEGTYDNCQYETVIDGVSLEDLKYDSKFEITKDIREGQLIYTRENTEPGSKEVFMPGAPTRDFATGLIGYFITDTCRDNKLIQVVSTDLKNPQVTVPIFFRAEYSVDEQKNLSVSYFDPAEIKDRVVPPPEDWALVIKVRCERK